MPRKYTIRAVGDYTSSQRLNALQGAARRVTLQKELANAFENMKGLHPVLGKMSVSDAVNSIVSDWCITQERGRHA